MRIQFRTTIVLLLLLLTASAAGFRWTSTAQQPSGTRTVTFARDESLFPNPERGFYIAYQPTGGGRVGQQDTPHPPLRAVKLRELRARPEAITLIRDNILIPRRYWGKPIAPQYLNELQSNFDAVREAGLKTVPRLLYDWSMQNRDPDEATISRHLQQLAPLLRKNSDVIAWMQGGLFGGAGEGNASDQGYVTLRHRAAKGNLKWQGLSEAGKRLWLQELRVLPPERMMNVRYPRLKWDLFGWTPETAMRHVRTPQNAFNGSEPSRVGFYNQGFMGSPEHYAMFQMKNEAAFTSADAEFVVHEGEISNASAYKLRDDQVRIDMARYKMTALNCGGDAWPQVAATWKRNGDYDEIARRMGYRFRLINTAVPVSLRPGSTFTLRMRMTNDGYARAMNPRGVAIVLREQRTRRKYSFLISAGKGNRLWLPGPAETKNLTLMARLPAGITPGSYEVLLHLHDPHPALRNRPEYSIRLANRRVWEPDTGYNRLLHHIKIS